MSVYQVKLGDIFKLVPLCWIIEIFTIGPLLFGFEPGMSNSAIILAVILGVMALFAGTAYESLSEKGLTRQEILYYQTGEILCFYTFLFCVWVQSGIGLRWIIGSTSFLDNLASIFFLMAVLFWPIRSFLLVLMENVGTNTD
jgi:hypothetical protein